MTQADISRATCVGFAIQQVLPCAVVWRAVADQRVLVDATEQRVSRQQASNEAHQRYYSGKKKQFTLKTQLVTDGEYSIQAIGESVPEAAYDKTLSDEVGTLERVPDGCEVDADKGYQGFDKQVKMITVMDTTSGTHRTIPRLLVQTPYQKPKGRELTKPKKPSCRLERHSG